MIEWRNREDSVDGYDNDSFVSSIYDDKYGFYSTILTKDGYMFLLNVLQDLQLAKNVCELALTENKDWQWWLGHLNKWWYENVSQL